MASPFGKMLVVAVLVPTSIAAACLRAEDAVTTVRITGKVLVGDCSRLGINLGGDNYYSGAALVKNRLSANFEGTSYRQCHFGPVWTERGCSTWFGVPDAWRELLLDGNGRYTILSGPSRGTSGVIRAIEKVAYEHQGKAIEQDFFVLDKLIEPAAANGGILVENLGRLDEGKLKRPHDYWMSDGVAIRNGDVPSGCFGVSAMFMDATSKRQFIRFGTHYRRYGEVNGRWRVRFWSKRLGGNPVVAFSPSREDWGESKQVIPADKWQRHELSLRVDGVPEPDLSGPTQHLTFVLSADGGSVLIDDVEACLEGDTNPTAFRDDCVNMLRKFNPGVIRQLQMGGNTLRNSLAPPLQSHAFASQKATKPGPYDGGRHAAYGLHQLYELCEHLGCDPWYCLPGTLKLREMSDFMEYLAGPADTPFGGLRAELGHARPWTETLGTIHVEFGNEAWNHAGPYQLGGFNGEDYWSDLIAVAKRSPYYSPKIVFHAGGQAANSWLNASLMPRVANADRFGLAPYIIQSLSKGDMRRMTTDDDFFRWAFAWPIWRSRDPEGAMRRNEELARENGMELSIYEVNHHITHGDGPLEPRNRLTTSIGGGLNVCNGMLLMLKEHHIRAQCLFSLVQNSYNAHGIGPVRLWGTALTMRAGHERYRPTFLACATANRVIGGSLVQTIHEGANPTFVGEGVFSRQRGVEKYEAPVLWSYAFRDGNRRGLILVNLDTREARPVEVCFEGESGEAGEAGDGGEAGGVAESWILTASRISACNEFEQPEPLVRVAESQRPGFRSGSRVTVPPFSMIALGWTQSLPKTRAEPARR